MQIKLKPIFFVIILPPFNQLLSDSYDLAGTQILAERGDGWTRIYIYDENGSPIGFKFRTSSYASGMYDYYYYVKNLQGDVTKLYGADGTLYATYKYDAWGNHTVTYSNGGASIAAVNTNPIRYRSYYYDTESNLYYLNSRYYSQILKRFINADDTTYLGADGTPLSYNLFAYCKNNPVNGYDPMGHWDWNLFGKVLFTTVVVVGCLTGVGFIAATAAAATATSVAAAVTVSVATAGVSTVLSAVDGAICAQQSGGKWYDGAMAGAIGGSAGALVSSITNPTPGTDVALRMNTAGRVASSLLYDVSYDLFSTGEIKAANVAMYAMDVTMDATLAPINYYYTGNISNGYLRSSINGLSDAFIDVFQTIAYLPRKC